MMENWSPYVIYKNTLKNADEIFYLFFFFFYKMNEKLLFMNKCGRIVDNQMHGFCKSSFFGVPTL